MDYYYTCKTAAAEKCIHLNLMERPKKHCLFVFCPRAFIRINNPHLEYFCGHFLPTYTNKNLQKCEKGFCSASCFTLSKSKFETILYLPPKNGTSLEMKHVKQQPNTKKMQSIPQTKAKNYEANVSSWNIRGPVCETCGQKAHLQMLDTMLFVHSIYLSTMYIGLLIACFINRLSRFIFLWPVFFYDCL